jgi:hypothetical protein
MSVLQLTRMWGSSGVLEFTNASASNTSQAQFSDIRLPEACVCAIYFDAQVLEGSGLVNAISLVMFIGLGRTNIRQSRSYNLQPTPGNPLQIYIPWQPAASIQATVTGSGTSASSTPYRIGLGIQVSPIVRIPMAKDPLEFGMALPGEADAADDAMYEELEEQAPDRVAVMREQQLNGQDPHDEVEDPDPYDDDDDGEEPRQIQIPPTLRRRVLELRAKLGRAPKVKDLRPSERQILREFRRAQR